MARCCLTSWSFLYQVSMETKCTRNKCHAGVARGQLKQAHGHGSPESTKCSGLRGLTSVSQKYPKLGRFGKKGSRGVLETPKTDQIRCSTEFCQVVGGLGGPHSCPLRLYFPNAIPTHTSGWPVSQPLGKKDATPAPLPSRGHWHDLW